jgi:hypothetical protein
MTQAKRDPVIDQWLIDEFGEQEGGVLQRGEQLSVLALASRRPNVSQIPDTVLTAWRRSVVRQRLTVDQSEDAFIERALGQGYTWERIAEELGHPTPEAAQRRHEELKAEITRLHPSNNERPHLA